MTNPRIRERDASDDDSPSRNVRPRRSIFSDDPYLEHTNRTEESDPEEEPFEDEEDPHPTLPRSPSAIPPPVPSSPTIPPSPVYPSLRFATSRQENTLRWDWMPTILKWWRRAEQLPVLPEVPGLITPIPPLTQEPVHHTIPILITRLVTHDHQLDQLERAAHDRMDAPTSEVEHLQHQVSEVESEMAELRDTVVSTHTEGVETRGEVATLRLQVEQGENRISELEQELATMSADMRQLRELEQELATMRADLGQLRSAAASSVRMVGLLEGMIERLDRPL